MPTQKKPATTYLTPERHAQLRAVAEAQGHTVSTFLGKMIELIIEDDAPKTHPMKEHTKSRREGKLTVRLGESVRAQVEQEARKQGVLPSTWAARILTARAQSAPQPVLGERKLIQRGFRQLRGAATNLNQIATAMNRDVFTGAHYVPTREEIHELKNAVASLEDQLTRYAAGRLEFQLGDGLSQE